MNNQTQQSASGTQLQSTGSLQPKKLLENILVEMLAMQDRMKYTDLHIEPDQIIMGRVTSNHWMAQCRSPPPSQRRFGPMLHP